MEKITFKNGQAPYINDTNLNKMQDNIEKAINNTVEAVSQITYKNWHCILPIRSDDNYLEIMCYGSNNLKYGNYSIANNFNLVPLLLKDSNSYGEITIPVSSIQINRHDWGFNLMIKRSEIQNIKTTQYDGIATVASGPLTIKST